MAHAASLAIAAALGALAVPQAADAQAPVTEKSEKADVTVETVARGLSHPWALAFLPDGRLLVTEKAGRLRIVAPDGKVSEPLSGVPRVVARGQGGLLDVALDPGFASNRLIYLAYAEPRQDGSGTTVTRSRLSDDLSALESSTVVFRQQPSHSGGLHFGSRLVFAPDGNLFVTTGDRFDLRDKAQDLSTHLGKMIRIRPDGSVPPDNPFVGRADARPEIWSYGHRNVQSAALDPVSGQVWTIEHGARGGDEVNIPRAGKNYGWPVISYGVNYDGTKIGTGTRKDGMEQPVFYWDPSIAPSGAAFYSGDAYPGWRGSLFVGALAGRHLSRLEISGNAVVREERLLRGLGERIRDVRQGPDGLLYLLTDADNGRVLRLRPR